MQASEEGEKTRRWASFFLSFPQSPQKRINSPLADLKLRCSNPLILIPKKNAKDRSSFTGCLGLYDLGLGLYGLHKK